MEYSEEECVVCGDYIPVGRVLLGYTTCLKHGEARKTFTAVPVPKSNYIIATSPEQVKSPYSHKGTR
jgi:hypothetical protein